MGRRLALFLGVACLGLASSALGAVTEFGKVTVGATSTADIAVPLTAAQFAAGPKIALHYGIDFSSGICTPTSNGCLLAVTFAPQAPGSLADAVVVKDSSGNVISKTVVHGTGIGPLGALVPGVVSVRYTPLEPSTAIFGLAVDPKGAVYFASGYFNQPLLRLDPGSTTPTTIAGAGTFTNIGSIALDAAGDVFVANGDEVQEIEAETGTITTVPLGYVDGISGVAVDLAGDIFVLGSNQLLRVDATTNAVTVVAGGGAGIALDGAGDVFISEADGFVLEVDATTQIIQTIAGNGTSGYSGDGGPATQAQLGEPSSIAVDRIGNVYVADSLHFVIRKIDAVTQIISTVAGASATGSLQDGVLASQAQFVDPEGIAVDSRGNLFFATSYISGVYEVVSSTPTLPFNWPGTFGATPFDNESIVNTGNAPLTINTATVSGPFALQASSSGDTLRIPDHLGRWKQLRVSNRL